MKIINLASGSKGNCTFINSKNTNILIDAGISLKRINEELLKNNILLTKLDGILVTHEHTDHIGQLAKVAKHYKAPIYIVKESFENIPSFIMNELDMNMIKFINPEKKHKLANITFVPIEMSHDTKYCCGYLLKLVEDDKELSLSYTTDTGRILDKYYPLLKQMDIMMMESNHDVEMLLNSNRAIFLKQRILSERGHLSNEECYAVLTKALSANTKKIALCHLSEECNLPSLAIKTANDAFNEVNIHPDLVVCEQNTSTILYDGEEND